MTQGSAGGKLVLDFLLAEVENLTGKIVFILAGYQGPMGKFFGHNPGLTSRFPHELKFEDYTDDELLQIPVKGLCLATLMRWLTKTEGMLRVARHYYLVYM